MAFAEAGGRYGSGGVPTLLGLVCCVTRNVRQSWCSFAVEDENLTGKARGGGRRVPRERLQITANLKLARRLPAPCSPGRLAAPLAIGKDNKFLSLPDLGSKKGRGLFFCCVESDSGEEASFAESAASSVPHENEGLDRRGRSPPLPLLSGQFRRH